jgi:hypothetical protein
MTYYEKYLKYKNKYLNLLEKSSHNSFEIEENPLAIFKKYNFIQTGGALPKMYSTDVPARLEAFLKGETKFGIVYAPTGYGKTVTGCRVIAKVVNEMKATGRKIKGEILMPFRVSVKEMYTYLQYLNGEQRESLNYGYAMGGGDKSEGLDSCDAIVQTVGYWLVKFLQNIDDPTEKIIMLDEVHDASWQTNLVLNLLVWKIKRGANIKLLISSATLDVGSISEKYQIHPEVLAIPPELANVDMNFNADEDFNPFDNASLNAFMLNYITQVVEGTERHILVLMPGEKEILNLIRILKDNAELKTKGDFAILPLYSQLSDEEIREAIGFSEKRKIIIATNMVENAITIDDLSATIDSCVRKELFVDQDNIKEIRTTLASKANIKQTAGRSGRQGDKGIALLALSEARFNELPDYTLNEVDKQPLYRQLIIIIKNGLPFDEILSSVSPERIMQDITYLVDREMLEPNGASFRLTAKGIIVSQLNTIELFPAIFFANCWEGSKAEGVDMASYFYYMTLLTAWMSLDRTFFANSKSGEQPKYESLLRRDSLETFLNIWITFNQLPKKQRGSWCFQNGIYADGLNAIDEMISRLFSNFIHLEADEAKYVVIRTNFRFITRSYEQVKEMFMRQFIRTFSPFKLRLLRERDRGNLRYQNSALQNSVLNSRKIFVRDAAPNKYVLGLTFFKSKGYCNITDFIIRERDAEDVQVLQRKLVALKNHKRDQLARLIEQGTQISESEKARLLEQIESLTLDKLDEDP